VVERVIQWSTVIIICTKYYHCIYMRDKSNKGLVTVFQGSKGVEINIAMHSNELLKRYTICEQMARDLQ
jgi:hypothetical protein